MSSEIGRRLQAVIDTAIDGIITIDSRGIIETVNRSALALFGYDEAELIGKNVSILMPLPYSREHDSYLERYHRTNEPRIIGIGREVEGKTRSGRVFPLRLAVSKVVLNDRIIFTGIVHDLSEVKDSQEALQRANEVLEQKVEARTAELETLINDLLSTNRKLEKSELELTEALNRQVQLNELKSRFVSMASHEFRTPLSTILSSVSLISRYPRTEDDDKRQKHIGKIKSAVVNLTGILNDFLSLGRIEEGRVEIVREETDILDLLRQVSEEVQDLLKEAQSIRIDYRGTKRRIRTDGRILRNVLFNLISNAIKYSDEVIECIVEFYSDHLIVRVKDKGIGIPQKEQEMIFDRFFRASNAELLQGTGLGLNIVKRYMMLLQGEVDFESRENEGSTFYITLHNI